MRILRITLYVTLFVLLTCKIIVGVTSFYFHRNNAGRIRQTIHGLQQGNAALQTTNAALVTLGAVENNVRLYTALHDPADITAGSLQLDTLFAQLDAACKQLNAGSGNNTVTRLQQRKTAIYNRLTALRQAPGPRLANALTAEMPALSSLTHALQQQARQMDASRKTAVTAETDENLRKMQNGFTLVFIFLALTATVTAIIWWDYHRKGAQLRREKQNAVDAARARSVFLANMSHEIRTPLNAVVGFTEQLTHTPLQEHQQELLRHIDVSAGMLMNVVNDVLDFSKLDSDYISIQKQPFTLYQALADVVNSMRVQAVNKQLELDFTFEGSRQQHVCGDVFRLKQILVNLLSNAIKYTEAGRVAVKAKLVIVNKDKQGLFLLEVEDTGPGVPPDILPRIFERFYQVRTLHHKAGGTGLGLAITQRLIRLHGGNISVKSEVGKGSCFSCQIPYELASPSQTVILTRQDIEQLASNQLDGLYVLIADDQEMNLLLLKIMLTRWKCRFDMARDGAIAYELFKTNNYDLVLLDLQMPEMNGLEVVQRIRAHEDAQKAKVPVLVVTADIARHDEETFRKAGFNDWLLKPFKEKDIYKSILKHLPRAGIKAN
ncbi:MAG TPA: ATP-binding protein [Chitinophaga sp.]|uniref:ATP-binding protein n=1 Tax=Chitinophaga sp. TaxID=1869181 RepID=UPI002DBB59C2|nr:ATP-binding protein [Chitinophaga sp.]HEU4554977.1 ATP-binding protein [Chitinophaga sp.]